MYKFLTILLVIALVVACTPPATPTAPNVTPRPSATLERPPTRTPITNGGTPIPPASVSGKFTYAPGDGSIWVQDAATGQAQPVVTPSPDVFADAPQFSPDGNHIAYTQSTLTSQGVAQTSIHVIDTDGTNDRALANPPDLKTSLNWPAWSPDGKSVYYTLAYPVPPNKQHSEIDRVSVGGGAAQTVINDARSAVVSQDGKRVSFLRFNFDTFTAGLWIADADGKNPKLLVAEDVFALIAAPHFSPDGQWILFAASGPPSKQLPALLVPISPCTPTILCALVQRLLAALAAPAYADGLPWDLWLVSVDGAHYKQLTNVGADSPWPTWSRDGKHVTFFDTSGIYLVDVDKRSISRISRNGGHGVFDWWTGP